jgi:hypothetical protein
MHMSRIMNRVVGSASASRSRSMPDTTDRNRAIACQFAPGTLDTQDRRRLNEQHAQKAGKHRSAHGSDGGVWRHDGCWNRARATGAGRTCTGRASRGRTCANGTCANGTRAIRWHIECRSGSEGSDCVRLHGSGPHAGSVESLVARRRARVFDGLPRSVFRAGCRVGTHAARDLIEGKRLYFGQRLPASNRTHNLR